MNNYIQNLKQKSGLGLLLFSIFLLSHCNPKEEEKLQMKSGTITGIIGDYDGIIQIGQLIYWDAISRHEINVVFIIDSAGSFEVPFNLFHPIYNSAFLEIGGEFYGVFLEPGKDFEIKIIDKSIEFIGKNGLANTQILVLEDTIYKFLEKEIEHCDTLHTTNLPFQYLKEQYLDLANKKISILNTMDEKYNFEPAVINALIMDAYYKPAKSWINYNNDYSTGRPEERNSLPDKFYEDLFATYSINNSDALVSCNYSDYISNIVSVFREDGSSGTIDEFTKGQGGFTDDELTFAIAYYSRDTSIINTEGYKSFLDKEMGFKLWHLRHRYLLNNVLSACQDIPRGIGRDIIISQAFCDWYYCGFYRGPSLEDWEKISELMESEIILNYLQELDNTYNLSITEPPIEDSENESIKYLSTSIKDILNKYKGQVIYIDIWATWCVPCRNELPYSKNLIKIFKDKEVAFLFLCCKSPEEDWENILLKEELPGHHYFISEEDYVGLDKYFNVKGYPTHILIDKKGEVVTTKALSPKCGPATESQIKELLK